MTTAEAWFNIALRPRKPEGSLELTTQGGHLDSHTAPELCQSLEKNSGFIPKDKVKQEKRTVVMYTQGQIESLGTKKGLYIQRQNQRREKNCGYVYLKANSRSGNEQGL